MSEIKKLIERLCPDGVEYKKLGEIGTFTRGNGLQKKDFLESGFPCIHYGQIYTRFGLFTDKTLSFCSFDLATKLVKAKTGDMIIACTSENVEDVCKPVVWLGEGEVATGGHACVFSHNQEPKYVAYFFRSEKFFEQKKRYEKGVKVIDIKIGDLEKIEIPVPPLEVQTKIVEILDNFTELEAELEAKLEAELEARRKQYEYYRNQLLTFDKVGGARFDVKWMKLGEISMYAKERIDGNLLSTENYVGVENLLKDKGGKTSSSSVPCGNAIKFKPGDILIGNIRPYLKKIWLANIIGGTNGDVLCIRVSRNDLVSSDYLYKCLSSDSFFNYDNSHAKGGKMPRGDKKAVMEYSIPIPPLEEQKRIVSILDRFEALTTDLQSGLPAEIEARRKQYEYYREKLLTFKRI